MEQISQSRPDSCLGLNHVQSEMYCGAHSMLRQRALPTETKVESGMSLSKSGTSVNSRNSGKRSGVRRQMCSGASYAERYLSSEGCQPRMRAYLVKRGVVEVMRLFEPHILGVVTRVQQNTDPPSLPQPVHIPAGFRRRKSRRFLRRRGFPTVLKLPCCRKLACCV